MTQTNRAQLRDLSIAALLNGGTLAGSNVFLYAWPTNEKTSPAILVNWSRESKISGAKTVANFNTTFVLRLDVRVVDVTMAAANAKLDTLVGQIQQVILTDPTITPLLQEFPAVDCVNITDADSEFFIASAILEIHMSYFEVYQPQALPLSTITVSVDLQNIFDPSGTYTDPLFPNAGTPAPRTTGPDSRLEGYVEADNLNTNNT
jgi:hypothetical protein